MNLSREFLGFVREQLGLVLQATSGGPGEPPELFFHYIVGILHSEGYRAEFRQRLLQDFPEVPLPRSVTLFREIATFGADLSLLHSFEAKGRNAQAAQDHPFVGDSRLVARGKSFPGWSNGKVLINDDACFHNVARAAWEFRVGKYQVLDKWLRDRTARQLSVDEVKRYQEVVSAVTRLTEVVTLVDAAIDGHGGWPDAFIQKSGAVNR